MPAHRYVRASGHGARQMNRKYLQHSSLFAGLLAATILGRVAETSAQDAGSFRGGSAHPGLYSAPAITGEPKLLWRFQTKGRIVSSPAIADGVVYVGSTDHYFYAIDERTGAEIWKLKTGSRISSSALVSGGLVYFESYDGQFYAVDKSNGAVKWKFAIPGERRFAAPHIHGALPAAQSARRRVDQSRGEQGQPVSHRRINGGR